MIGETVALAPISTGTWPSFPARLLAVPDKASADVARRPTIAASLSSVTFTDVHAFFTSTGTCMRQAVVLPAVPLTFDGNTVALPVLLLTRSLPFHTDPQKQGATFVAAPTLPFRKALTTSGSPVDGEAGTPLRRVDTSRLASPKTTGYVAW